MTDRQRIEKLEALVAQLISEDSAFITLNKNIAVKDKVSLVLPTTTGMKIGTAPTQKLGFYGATPVVRQTAPSSPSGGVVIDSTARAAIDDLRTGVINLGLFA